MDLHGDGIQAHGLDANAHDLPTLELFDDLI